jgi:hypothetical protein
VFVGGKHGATHGAACFPDLGTIVANGTTGLLILLHKHDLSRWVGLWIEDDREFDQEVADAFATIRTHLAQHLLHLAGNPWLVHSMGMAGRRHMEVLYSLPTNRSQLIDTYRAAIRD